MTSRCVRSMIGLAVIVIILGWVGSALAKQKGKEKGEARVLSKITFIHYKKGHAKPPWAGGGKGDDTGDSGLYTYLAKGAKWKVVEGLFLNRVCGENVGGSLDGLIEGAVYGAIAEWEGAGGKSLAIFGSISVDENVSYDDGAYRGFNTISFGRYKDSGVIAVTSVWGYFGGKPSAREIVEAHILMNDDYEWGDAAGDSDLMDVQNIMTHEMGHWAGMGDLYEVAAGEETMYGYSSEGETTKRDLYYGDITGITGLYK